MTDQPQQSAQAPSAIAYGLPMIILHWLTAIFVFILIPVGLALDKVPEGPLQDSFYNGHRSAGLLVLILAVVRVMTRRLHGTPAPAAVLTDFERKASTAVHHLLYTLLILTPIVGWGMVSAYRAEITFFGLFVVPPILPKNETLYEILEKAHAVLGITMALTVLLHAGAGLMHGVIKRDGVLQRMLPWTKG
ncbi:MAG: cytochrome b [Alphaproteobacteria bacterium]|nr:cytochrome b [Alphaproteobacteria bacterium]